MTGLAFPRLAVLGRAHLITLWTWAGLHKLLSTGFTTGGAAFIADGLGVPVALVAWLTPMAEIGLGMLALIWRTRRIAVVMSVLVHGAILLTLSSHQWNSSVWLWNVALPVAASHYLLVARDQHLVSQLKTRSRLSTVFAATGSVWLAAWLYPAGFYAGITDAYLAHNLYTSNTQQAVICSPSTAGDDESALRCADPFGATWSALNVPFPPETRLYRQWFEESCVQGEVVRVAPIQTKLTDDVTREFGCPRLG